MLLLSAADVEGLLDLDELVNAVANALADLSAGRASMPARGAAFVPGHDAFLAAMPAHLPSVGALTTKLVSLFPHNVDRPTHQALICCFDPDDGTPLALMDGRYITAARTAAGSALATRLLARADAATVAVIGTGVQGRAHAWALARLPATERITVAGRDPARVAALVADLAELPVTAAASIEEAVRTADVVCAATQTDEPVVRRDWLRPGTHVNSVGYNPGGTGEVDLATLQAALLVVESRAAALGIPPAGAVELRRAVDAGELSVEGIHCEIGELVNGTATGRTDDEQITLYKSVGVAVQDAAAAALVLAAAQAQHAGVRFDL
jgi:alanine dehydrogenase